MTSVQAGNIQFALSKIVLFISYLAWNLSGLQYIKQNALLLVVMCFDLINLFIKTIQIEMLEICCSTFSI